MYLDEYGDDRITEEIRIFKRDMASIIHEEA